MKISYNWLTDYIDLSGYSIDRIAEILTDLGLEVASVEEVESVKGGLEGVVIGKVVECDRHPNADRLSVTRVDVGGDRLLDIVCGAPNVAAGQTVPVAVEGTVLYSPEGEPWEIRKGKIRGAVSEGMICAEDELGLGESHEGIMILPDHLRAGTPARDYFQIEKDYVIEIELTPNRSDATSHLGVAFDLAAYLKVNEGHSGEVRYPGVEDVEQDEDGFQIDVVVEDTEACPRYSGLTISGIRVGESPDWMKNRLRAIDVRPINNIVDITNYILHEYGQPLHAFDADKVPGKRIRVKTLKKDTSFVTLDEVERKLTAEDLMICDDHSDGLCIAGVFGGIGSGVTEETRNIFLESAHFSAKSVRKTSMHHLLRTDAAMVFEKGSDPEVTIPALRRAAQLVRELAGGKISSPLLDVYPKPIPRTEVTVRFAHVNRLIGIDLDRQKLMDILEALDMQVHGQTSEAVVVRVPTNKSDVTREADVIEEILRIYGLNNVESPEKIAISMDSGTHREWYRVRRYLSEYLAAQSFNEAMSLSLTRSRKYEDTGLLGKDVFVYVNNTSNVQLDILRPEMLFSALENLVYNQNRQQRDVRLFEFGRSYRMKQQEIFETEWLSLCGMGSLQQKSWKKPEPDAVDYFYLKSHVLNLFRKMNLSRYEQAMLEDERFEYGTLWSVNNRPLARAGKVSGHLVQAFGLKRDVYYAEIDFEVLAGVSRGQLTVEEIGKFPGISRDLALVMDRSRNFEEIRQLAFKIIKRSLRSVDLFDVYDNEEHLGKGKISYAISLRFEDPEKTLQDKEVDKLMGKFTATLEHNLQVQIRK
jgi:phenylalanyl-tRNA synthetase beta chain